MAKRKAKRKRRRRTAAKTVRRRRSSRKKPGFPKLDLQQSGTVAGALILAEVIRERVDIAWVSEQAVAFLVLAFFSRKEEQKKSYLAVAVGSQLKEVADMAGFTQQLKNLIPGGGAPVALAA